MRRYAEEELSKWIQRTSRKPLIIRGARQVGKSTLVRQFASGRNLKLHEINLERYKNLKNVFSTNNIEKILNELQFVIRNGPINQPGNLLFLDEIQAVPDAIQALRYFYEDIPELPVIAAGSLLEFTMSKHTFSMPVGRVEYLYIGPMTFQEVLDASGHTQLNEFLNNYRIDDDFPVSAHEHLKDLQRSFMLVGGMPEAVKTYLGKHDYNEAFRIHRSIIDTYRDDFAKYASQSDLARLQKMFDFIPKSAGDKFKYVNVDPNEHSRELRKAFDLLINAQVIMKALHTDASGIPIRATANNRIFKPYCLDCGVMSTMSGIQWISDEQLQKREFINEGKLAEQFIAQHLAYSGTYDTHPELYYWLREGKSSNAEVDFVIQIMQEIIPIEVKASRSGSLKSLLQFLYQKKRQKAVRFDLNPPSFQKYRHRIMQAAESVEVDFHLLSLPLYMIEQASRLFKELL